MGEPPTGEQMASLVAEAAYGALTGGADPKGARGPACAVSGLRRL
jgi:hypothetical protein